MREYNALIEEALNIGIKSPETYYYEGKIKGKENRDKGEGGNIIPGGKVVSGYVPDMDNKEASQKKKQTKSYNLLAKPHFNSLPPIVEKISMIKFPKFLTRNRK